MENAPISEITLTDVQFAEMTKYANASDNAADDLRRAVLLGFTDGVMVAPGALVRVPSPEHIGAGSFIGLYSYINGEVHIGRNVLIGPHCSLTAGHHKFDPATLAFTARTEGDYDNSIFIGDGCWLASGVTVTAGVKLGRGCLVCAGAVVTHDFPDFTIAGGLPAKAIGHINPHTGEYIWHNQRGSDG
ncbi:MAG: acyltransferase [Eubacteriales bacterium]